MIGFKITTVALTHYGPSAICNIQNDATTVCFVSNHECLRHGVLMRGTRIHTEVAYNPHVKRTSDGHLKYPHSTTAAAGCGVVFPLPPRRWISPIVYERLGTDLPTDRHVNMLTTNCARMTCFPETTITTTTRLPVNNNTPAEAVA